MSAASDHYEERYVQWFNRWEALPRWRWYKRACAFGRWKFYLTMMTEQIQIDIRRGRDA